MASTSLSFLAKKGASTILSGLIRTRTAPATTVALRSYSAKAEETDAELDARYVKFFDRPDIDGWEIRQAMTDLQHMDMVPDPTIVAAAFRACRRVNDFSLTVRILESVRVKCGNRVNEIWPYMMQELRPTMEELGIPTIEQMGYDKPELYMPSPYDP